MGRRTVVESPPPAPHHRPTRVLRAGGPAPGGRRWRDVALSVLGLLLLVAAAAMVRVLPEEEVVLPQFHMRMVEASDNLTTQRHYLDESEEGHVHEFLYEIPHDNVEALLITVGLSDDNASSLPDRFRVEVFDPAGAPRGEVYDIQNVEPNVEYVIPEPPMVPTYEANATAVQLTVPVADRPEEAVLTGERAGQTAAEMAQLKEAELRVPTNGTWRVRVTLIEAGDCPAASDDPTGSADRVAACLQETQAKGTRGEDGGNEFSVQLIRVNHFRVTVAPLE